MGPSFIVTNLTLRFGKDYGNVRTIGLEKPLSVSKLNDKHGNLEGNVKGSEDNGSLAYNVSKRNINSMGGILLLFHIKTMYVWSAVTEQLTMMKKGIVIPDEKNLI